MNMLKDGLTFLREQLHECASSPVSVYRNNVVIVETTAVYGATKFDNLDPKSGRRSFGTVDDLIFRGDVDYLPAPDDVYLIDGKRFVARTLNGELYRWEDSARIQFRVHVSRKER